MLVVDDSLPNAKVLCMLLKNIGLKTTVAYNGKEACSAIQTDMHRYKLIFMDSLMPEMTGPEATRVMRQDYKYPYLIIGATGNVSEDDFDFFIDNGADAVLAKPLSRKSIMMVLDVARKKKFLSSGDKLRFPT